jgi:RND superfamily putative drug exporter
VRRLTGIVITHRKLIGLIWLLALLAGGFASAHLSSRLSTSFDIPGTASDRADAAIVARYHSGGSETPLVAVISLPPGDTVARARAGLAAGFLAVARIGGTRTGSGRVASYASVPSPSLVSADGRTTFGLIFTPANGDPAHNPAISPTRIQRTLLARLPAGARVQVTGITPLTSTGGSSSTGAAVASEILIGSLGALAVLAFVFGSLLALVPLLIAAVSVTTAFLAIFGITYLTGINFVVQFLVGLIGLGVAIDYSLLLVTRWREEAAAGVSNAEAIEHAMASAGRAVVFSGVTVAIGLLVLVALPIPFIRSIGLGGMLIPLVSVAAAITLLPALLAGPGRRLEWPRRQRDDRPPSGWIRWASLVVRHRWAAAAGALVILGVLTAAAFGLQVGDVSVNALSQQGSARAGVVMLERAGIPVGVLTPIEVLVPAGTSPQAVAAAAASVPGVRGAFAPAGPAWRRGGTALVTVLPAADGSSPAGQAATTRVRQMLARRFPAAMAGGYTPGLVDQISSLYRDLPWVLAGLAVVTFVLLARAFRSLLLPAKAIIANLLSVAAVYGVLVLVWQRGYGSQQIWGLPATGAITAWIPLFVFAFVYGLSMDYEVFLLTRMREEYDATGSTTRAVITGIGRTGRLVTSAALILFLAMAALASAPLTFLKVFATGVGAGILLDATVVRCLLVPAVVALLGRWNWWLPGWAATILRVEPSPLPAIAACPPGSGRRAARQ